MNRRRVIVGILSMLSALPFANASSEQNMRLRIEYFDQNERFASLLPREGVVDRILEFTDSKGPWFLVTLDTPIQYEGKDYEQLLLMSRWNGYPIGGHEPTSVFVLLVPRDGKALESSRSYKEFLHVAWGMVSTIAP